MRSSVPTLTRGGTSDVDFEAMTQAVDDPGFADRPIQSPAPPPGEATLPRTGWTELSLPSTTGVPPARRASRRRVRWCVDVGTRIDTRSTFELWIAIAGGEIQRGVRVWREGLECWCPVEAVPELACAFPPDPTPTPGVVAAPKQPSDAAVALTPPAPPAALSPRRPPLRRFTQDAKWASLGVGTAMLAIGVAAFAGGRSAAEPGAPSARKLDLTALVDAVQMTAWAAEDPTASRLEVQAEPDEPSHPARTDPGQRRLRRGSR